MPQLSPPEYPYRPDAPLLSFGGAFSEDLARSLLGAIWHENREQPHETDVRSASGLTMLEAFRPRDQLECMLAAQGVAAHCAILDNFRRAANPNLAPLLVVKFRANSVSLSRMFCTTTRELTHLQSRPLPPRPAMPPCTPAGGAGDPPPETTPVAKPRARRSRAKTAAENGAAPTEASRQSVPDPVAAAAEPLVSLQDIPERPEDIEIRPDGTPGSLTAYAPKVPIVQVIPREAPIMLALATRPKPWRMVNIPKDHALAAPELTTTEVAAADNPPAAPPLSPEQRMQRKPMELYERIFTGDALARFAATRLDPDAPDEPLRFDHEDSMVELELISTGGDPAAEAEQAAMTAAHPEGKPIVTFRHGTKPPPGEPQIDGKEKPPPGG